MLAKNNVHFEKVLPNFLHDRKTCLKNKIVVHCKKQKSAINHLKQAHFKPVSQILLKNQRHDVKSQIQKAAIKL